ncbi:unnamed protein product [Gongylonema pulchrum]|uniref:Nuclear receptor domain-containing protein n=1 Tax=Gongylonema pulchrum TaxID=637853 RepID=A0A183E665_9BILA|nr:unnamed protein product [Gongylonema pulchrum]
MYHWVAAEASAVGGQTPLCIVNTLAPAEFSPVLAPGSSRQSPLSQAFAHCTNTNAVESKRDVNSPQSKKCKISGDTATGYHYGVKSCEPCNAFLRRSAMKHIQYTCEESENCAVNVKNRNRYQKSRFDKCVKVGMDKEAVRNDRGQR